MRLVRFVYGNRKAHAHRRSAEKSRPSLAVAMGTGSQAIHPHLQLTFCLSLHSATARSLGALDAARLGSRRLACRMPWTPSRPARVDPTNHTSAYTSLRSASSARRLRVVLL